jgi:hypothetical protein
VLFGCVMITSNYVTSCQNLEASTLFPLKQSPSHMSRQRCQQQQDMVVVQEMSVLLLPVRLGAWEQPAGRPLSGRASCGDDSWAVEATWLQRFPQPAAAAAGASPNCGGAASATSSEPSTSSAPRVPGSSSSRAAGVDLCSKECRLQPDLPSHMAGKEAGWPGCDLLQYSGKASRSRLMPRHAAALHSREVLPLIQS